MMSEANPKIADAGLEAGQVRTAGTGRFRALRALGKYLPQVLWVRELPDGRISYVSPAYEEIWGRKLGSYDEAYQFFVQSIHPDDREALLQRMREETAGAETESEYRIVRPDGGIRWIRSRAVPDPDESGEIRRIVGFAEDITASKRMEQGLREAQQRHRALLDSISDGASLRDADGRYIEVNLQYAQRWNLEPQVFIGKTVFEILPREVARDTAADDVEVIRSRAQKRVERQWAIGGELRWLEIIKTPIFDEAGRIVGIAGLSRDITERKLSESQRAARDASLRVALMKEVNHRIKNSLQGVMPMIQELAIRHPETANLVEAVISRVGAIASVHGLYGSFGDSEHRLEQVLEALIASLGDLYAGMSLRLSKDACSQSVQIAPGEIVPLVLVVNELIVNAIKHSRGAADGGPVEIALESGGNCARVTIENRGGRLPAHFDFDSGAGLGTGLTLVRALLPPVGAALRFEDAARGAGTKAELTLRPPVITLVEAGARQS